MSDVYSSLTSTTAYVNGANPQTVAQLMTNFPPDITFTNMYARVSDLYGAVDDIMRCRYDGTAYRWVPQRPNFTGTTAVTGGTISLIPLVTPPTLRITAATLLSAMTITPSTTNAYIGQQQKIIQEGTLGVFSSTITGLIGSNITVLGNTTKILEYGSTGWFQA